MKRRTRKPTKTDSCNGKKQMDEDEARSMVSYRINRGAVNVEAYYCRFCDHWHTGTRKRMRL